MVHCLGIRGRAAVRLVLEENGLGVVGFTHSVWNVLCGVEMVERGVVIFMGMQPTLIIPSAIMVSAK